MRKVLILGGGGAGLSTAISAKEQGLEVVVVSKEYAIRSQTSMAQGGINAALGADDSVDNHIEDTLKSAKNLANAKMVGRMCSMAEDAIEWLESMGMPFSRTNEGKIAQRKLGGTAYARAAYAQDYSGLKLLHTLYDYARKIGVEFLDEHFLLDILVEGNIAYGAVVYELKTAKIKELKADCVVLATGGYSKIYNNHSTNSSAATADGIAAAKRAGCSLRNMEYVQFHPTALKSSSILISEAARGAGAKLLNDKGERFVDELKPRDEVSLAIYKQIKNGREVFLDARDLGESFINSELPQERKLAMLYEKTDPVKELVPIKPAAHFTMGGIAVDEELQTSVANLFAVGECSEAGVHGGNRLGGNALLEIVVFGKRLGEHCATASLKKATKSSTAFQKNKQTIEELFKRDCSINFYEKKAQLGDLLYEKCGIVRYEQELHAVLEFIEVTTNELCYMGIKDNSKHYNTNLIEFLEFVNSLEVAKVVVLSAIANKESIGANQRGDI